MKTHDANRADFVITSQERVSEISREIAEVGAFAFDFEFVSDGRYLPDLALVQLAWGDRAEPAIAAIDVVEADPTPVLELVANEAVECIVHAAKQDLGLLHARYGLTATSLWDTQIAAAFLGLGDQVGYANLVHQLLGIRLDKGAQFTDWLNRPLSERQLSYAMNDVVHLPPIWHHLRQQLDSRARLEWVASECASLARGPASTAEAPVYASVKGWRALPPRGLGVLAQLARWRHDTARARNKPLSWILDDSTLIAVAKGTPRSPSDVKRIRSGGRTSTLRRHADEIAECVRLGMARPVTTSLPPKVQLSARGQVWASVANSLIQSLCVGADVAPRFVGARADAEQLVAWYEQGRDANTDIALLSGWRRHVAGDAVLGWLDGEFAIVPGDATTPLRLVRP